jgi:HK97 family phage portal protein
MAFSADELTAAAGVRRYGVEFLRSMQPVTGWRAGWRVIHEATTGAFQRNEEISVGDLSCYPALYACLNRISQDIGKLPFQLQAIDSHSIWNPVENPAYSPVLRKPNPYQTAQQFREAWVLSKLINGNAYILKVRDNRSVVIALYVLDPCRVVPMISDAGRVFYQLNYPTAQNLLPELYPAEQLVIPASEIIHDRLNCFHHQLIGVPPLCAAYWPAAKNMRILKSAAEFFQNNAQPGGILTAPAGLSDKDADALKAYWETNYSGSNAGKIAVIGADMKFTTFAMKSADSQLVEQMRYSDEQICQPFGVPPFKIGIGAIPAGLGVDAINLLYHEDALSGHIEAMENLLDEALSLPRELGIWLDTDPLFRMDVGKQADVESKLVGGKIKTPDEARRKFGLAPTGGGNTLWGQNQDYPLGMLADRASWDPDMQPPAGPPIDPEPEDDEDPLTDEEMDETMEAADEA